MTATEANRSVAAEPGAARLRLAPRAGGHADALFPLIDDWEVVRMLAVVPWPVARGDLVRILTGDAPGIDTFAILRGNAPIGLASVKRIGSGSPPRVMPRLGFWIGRRHWGQGLGTEVVGLLVAHAFATSRSDVVGAGVFTDNPASRRVLEKCGFHCAGSGPMHCVPRDAEVTVDNMILARADWEPER